MSPHPEDTIVAMSTGQGVAALAVIRLSGRDALSITQRVFRGKDLAGQPGHTVHFGTIADGDTLIDEVLVSVFRAPHSFTREESVEISCHGSPLIVKDIIKLLLRNGARLAEPGEFTRRAFLNGRFDLAQAEAVADLIHSETENARQAALNMMRGGFSKEIQRLREALIHFASLIELELDFGEEDVTFADRDDLKKLVGDIQAYVRSLTESFNQGNVIRNGVPTVIAGRPNAGKSTLLNVLLNDEKAIVSDIPGTTRDVIEDEIIVGGINFRFMDTAGLRDTEDAIEMQGVARTRDRMKKAALIIYVFDLSAVTEKEILDETATLTALGIPFIRVGNKRDKAAPALLDKLKQDGFVLIAAARHEGIEALKEEIVAAVNIPSVRTGDVLVTNLRHYHSLLQTGEALDRVLAGLDSGITGDFLALDIRQALHHLGEITGVITTDDLLANIFERFCIGK